MPDLSGKVAIVTGAGRYRGIGRDTALALAQAGADVAVTGTGRSSDTFPDDEKAMGWRDIESVADEIRAMGRRALTIVADLSDPAQARGIVEQTVAGLGSVDILVNNAAVRNGRRTASPLSNSTMPFGTESSTSRYTAPTTPPKPPRKR